MALTHVQQTGLQAAILAYLAAADGGRFARAAAAFKEELQRGGDGGENSTLEVSGSVLAKAWAVAHRGLNGATKTAKVFDAIKAGDMAEVELYVCVGVDVKALRYGETAWPPVVYAAYYNRLEMVQLFVKIGHDKDAVNAEDSSPLWLAAQEGHVIVVQYLVEQGADKD
jgi:hypothetical protein